MSLREIRFKRVAQRHSSIPGLSILTRCGATTSILPSSAGAEHHHAFHEDAEPGDLGLRLLPRRNHHVTDEAIGVQISGPKAVCVGNEETCVSREEVALIRPKNLDEAT